ncbi:molybdopterin-dependent oxidoreductase [Bradyrhizobium manausense]|uniref:molybdopterin-dependent oxidoreductase n=1 Tax=Bradyrhizobium TaxID=374 RepID=UPI001BAA3E8D|nr:MULTISPECIES: molybdopterin-dependent oxidoreductase [Bradyrhizobium]MBR0826358.1 molybdopterin-dependent oxidoreductase [Bradyrhizobium manausense]UVO28766.1 molybdopterin-dependent oxidoreductase [Bradyrhizobium arachidis]
MQNSEWRKTACNLCYINCGIEVRVDDGRITKVRGDREHPRSQGYLCNKASRIPFYAHHRDRLTAPLRRRADGGFDEIDWDTAITEIAARLRDLVERHGGKSIALYGGGGQGNHAGGAYANALLRALGSRHVFNALAQEKTGDFWVNGHMFGSQTCHTAEDVHHCDLLFVIGANPWVAHGFPNARDHLNQIRKDPARKMIVIDPRRSETAEMADLHLAVRPGADAFLLGAILATLVRREAIDHDFIAAHTVGYDEVRDALLKIPVAQWADAADVPLDQIERCAHMIVAAKAMTVRVELGIQQGVHSTLNSYLEKLLIMLTGSFGRKGTNQLHSWLQPLWGNSPNQRFAATDTEVIGGLLPPNLFCDAVLADHPDRLRAAWIDSSNPANTAANTAAVELALRALDLVVVVDVAMTETAQLAHYVLPASSQYEKTEFTLFNFEFPANVFHVRAGVVAPLEGTLPEPEIYTRLARALGLLPGDNALAPLREAAFDSRAAFAGEFRAFMGANPQLASLGALVLYHTLGATLPDGTAAAAPLWMASLACAKRSPQAVRRALKVGPEVPDVALGDALFDAIVGARHGTVITEHDYNEVWTLLAHPDRKVRLAIAPMLEWLEKLDPASARPGHDYPFVLAAGQRRMFNANQIFRDPAWRRDDPDGALLINANDLATLGASDGDWIAVRSPVGRIVARAKRDDSMRDGQLALPHGYGQTYPTANGERLNNGPRINALTESGNRDPIAGTPYHKHVAVQLELLAASEAATYEEQSRRIHAASG